MRQAMVWRGGLAVLLGLLFGVWAAPAHADPAVVPNVGAVLRKNAAIVAAATGRPAGEAGVFDLADTSLNTNLVAVGVAHTCTITFLGGVWCWGENGAGQLGIGSTTDADLPVFVSEDPTLPGVSIDIDAGRAHTCTLAATDEPGGSQADTLFCWGDNNEGQLGDGSTTMRTSPVEITDDVVKVAAGREHTCALMSDETVSCWGRNDVGQLGLGTTGGHETTPQPVPGLTGIVDIAAGDENTCAVADDGNAWCWGSDADGQLGDGGGTSGALTGTPTPVDVIGVPNGFVQITVGHRHVCAIGGADADEAYCWGSDAVGQLGSGQTAADPSAPTLVTATGPLFRVDAGGDSACAMNSSFDFIEELDPTVYCWGDNSAGQLGVGDHTDRSLPVEVAQGELRSSPPAAFLYGYDQPMLASVNVGSAHTCAVDVELAVYCWGSNAAGQFGDGTTDDADEPARAVLGPDPATALTLSAGDQTLHALWKPPADTGVSTVLGYSVIAESTGGDALGSGCAPDVELSCDLGGLANDEPYAVFVATLTLAGLSFSDVATGTPRATASGTAGGDVLAITGTPVAAYLAAAGVLIGLGLALAAAGASRDRRSVRNRATGTAVRPAPTPAGRPS